MNAAIMYTLIVAPVFQNQAWAQSPQFENTNLVGIDETTNTSSSGGVSGGSSGGGVASTGGSAGGAGGSNTNSNQFGLDQEGIRDSANQQGTKPKRKALETLVMMSFALTALISPIAQRTARSKNDCSSNFSGPVSLFIIKLAGLMHVINEIRQFDKYSKKSKSVRDIQTGVAMDTIEGKSDDSKENKLMNYDDLFAKLIDLYEGQKDALKSKNKSLGRMDSSLKVGLALETVVAGACTGICIGHRTLKKAERKTLDVATEAYLTALETALATYTANVASAPYTPIATRTALATLRFTMLAYQRALDVQMGKKAVKAAQEKIYQSIKSATTWSALSSSFASLFVYDVVGGLVDNTLTEAASAAEEIKENAEMATGESVGIASETASKTLATAVFNAQVALEAAAKTDYTAATAACSASCGSTLGLNCQCFLTTAISYPLFEAALQAAKQSQRAIAPTYVGLERTINISEKVMGQGIGKAVSAVENVMAQAGAKLNAIISSINPAKAAAAGAEKLAKEAAQKTAEESARQAMAMSQAELDEYRKKLSNMPIETMFPILANYETLMSKRLTCCGSSGRLTGEPSLRIVIPESPGILYKRRDLIPPKGLFASSGIKEKKLDKNYIEVMLAQGRGEELYKEVMTFAMRTLAADMVYEEYLERMKAGEKITQHDYELMLARIEGALENGENEFTIDKLKPEDRTFLQLAFQRISSELGIPNAHAGLGDMWDNIGGFMGLGAVFLAVRYRSAVKRVYAFATQAPIYRVGFYTVLKLLTGWNIRNNEKSIDDIQKQIDFLNSQKELIKEKYTGGEDLLAISQGHMPGDSNFSFPQGNNSGGSQNCMNFGAGGISRTNCPAKNSKGSFSFPDRKAIANFQGFSTALDNISALGEAISNSEANSAHVDVLSGKLNAAANKLEKDSKHIQEELNSLYAEKDANGKAQSPLERMVGQMMGGFGGGSGGGLGGGAGMGLSASLSPNLSGENDKTSPEYKPSPVTDMGALEFGEGGIGSLDEFSVDGSEGIADAVVGKEAQNLDDFELADHDINVDTSASIFEVLSKRYLLSYPKVLDMKEPPKAEVPDKAKE
jgi:hypothetical protein